MASSVEVISFVYPDFIVFGQSSDAKLLKYGAANDEKSTGCIYAIAMPADGEEV